jgi:TetR/AcrR family transcriptional regulator, fatty acid metabolism regulator protein
MIERWSMRKPHNDPASAAAPARRGDRRAKILGAARALFTQQKNTRATMADIAARIGVAEGTLYLYFESKNALVAAVAAEWFEHIVTATEREARAIKDPLDLMRFLVQRHLDVIVGHKDMYLTLMREVRAGDEYRTSPVREVNRRYTRLLLSLLQKLAEEGRLADGLDARTMRDLVYGGVEHVAWTALLGDAGGFDSARKADEIATSFVRMLGLTPTARDDIERRLERIEAKLRLD